MCYDLRNKFYCPEVQEFLFNLRLLVHICVSNTSWIIKGKDKVHPRRGYEGSEVEYRYSSTCSLTSVLRGSAWLTPCPARFTPGKETFYPPYGRLGGPKGRCGWVWQISPPPVFDPGPTSP